MILDDDAGFTLPEVLVAIALSLVVSAVLAAIVIMALKTNDSTQQRLTESHDAQLSANTFDRDVQSSEVVATSDSDAVCNLALGSPATYSLVLHLRWTEPNGDVRIADYLVETRSGARPRALHRRLCLRTSGSSTTTLQRDVVISDNLASGASNPAVTCTPAGGCSNTSATVAIQITETSGYVFTMTAKRRVG